MPLSTWTEMWRQRASRLAQPLQAGRAQAHTSIYHCCGAVPVPEFHKPLAHTVKNEEEGMASLEKQAITDKRAKNGKEEVSKHMVTMREVL